MGNVPDAVRRLVDRFDQDRTFFLSGDYKEEQLRSAFLNGPSLTIRHSDFVIRTSSSPFFAALGWALGRHSLDTIRARNWGSVPLFPLMGNAPDAVKRLVDRFDQDRKVFLSDDYKEEQLRAEFPMSRC